MPDLLIELFSEEIPARMQARAAADFKKIMTDKLVDKGLTYEGAESFVTPRRLTLCISGLPVKTADMIEERKGPKVGAPEKALAGFMRAAGLNTIEEAQIQSDPKKGDFYIARTEKKGVDASTIIGAVLEETILNFPWPKSMRWGTGSLKWVRPLHNIFCSFGVEGEVPEYININIEGVSNKAESYGHRFLAPQAFDVKRFEDYEQSLEKAYVVLNLDRRKDIILNDAKNVAFAHGLELVEDEALLNEVAGLVEWPVVLLGRFDEAFLQVPEEVIITSLKSHQKCFCLKDSKTGKLSNGFILASNLKAIDGGDAIVAGNERVIRARLADSQYFWETDQAIQLSERLPALDKIIFHQKLGSQGERVSRIRDLAIQIAKMIGADEALTAQAAQLSKADLVTEMVGEFPELQGLMGRYYAQLQGESQVVANAIEAHYKPQGPSEAVPTDAVAISVALADKLDMLFGFWSINEKPTGSKDPFALRRAALGVVRIILENKLSLDLNEVLSFSKLNKEAMKDLYQFIEDRMFVYLKDKGHRYDHVAAILKRDNKGDISRQYSHIQALENILQDEDGINLMAGLKRARNMLASEQKKTGKEIVVNISENSFEEKAENDLHKAIIESQRDIQNAIQGDNYKEALIVFSKLRNSVDSFFEDVKIDSPDAVIKQNRLSLLQMLQDLSQSLANFSQIEG